MRRRDGRTWVDEGPRQPYEDGARHTGGAGAVPIPEARPILTSGSTNFGRIRESHRGKFNRSLGDRRPR